MLNNKLSKELICVKDFNYSSQYYKEDKVYFVKEYMDDYDFYVCEATREPTSPLPLYPLPYEYRKYFVDLVEYRKLKLDKINESR